MSRRQRRHDKKATSWRAQAGTASPRVAAFSGRGAFVPQQEHVSWVQLAEGRVARRVHQRRGQRATWPQAGPEWYFAWYNQALCKWDESGSSWRRRRRRNCAGECIGFLETKVQQQAAMKKAEHLGQKMDQARIIFRRAVESGEKAMEVMHKAQESFEQAQQEVIRAQTDLENFMQEAPLPVLAARQVNVSLCKTLETLTRLVETMWNPRRQPREHLVRAIQCRRISFRPLRHPGSGSRPSAGRRARCGPPDHGRERCRPDGRFRGFACPGRPRRQRKRGAGEQAEPQLTQVQQGHGTLSSLAASTRSRCCLGPLYDSPKETLACFDQTCVYPGEGQLTTLDAPVVQDMCLTPTQEFVTCAMVRRKTREKMNEKCGACEPTLEPRKNGYKCRKCNVWACNAACARDAADLHICPLTDVASHECHSYAEGTPVAAASGAPRSTQCLSQACDVRAVDTQEVDQLREAGTVCTQSISSTAAGGS